MQQGEHEIISDDGLMQLYFTQVDASNELLPAHWHEHLEILSVTDGRITASINDLSYELGTSMRRRMNCSGEIFSLSIRETFTTRMSMGTGITICCRFRRSI